jgi:hypothetical protein
MHIVHVVLRLLERPCARLLLHCHRSLLHCHCLRLLSQEDTLVFMRKGQEPVVSSGQGWHRLRSRRWWCYDLDIAPQAVAEGCSVGSFETPVRDCSTLALRCLHDNAERNIGTRRDRDADDVALAGVGKLRLAQSSCVVNIEHVVATDVSDTAPSRPGLRTRVTKGPCLDKLLASKDLRAINDGVADEMSIKSVRLGLSLERLVLVSCMSWVKCGLADGIPSL